MRTVFVWNEHNSTEIMNPVNNIERLRKMRKIKSRRLNKSTMGDLNASVFVSSNRSAVEYK